MPRSAPDDDTGPLPPEARFLKRLVIVMTVVLVTGVVTITGLLAVRLNPSLPPLPDAVTLPEGVRATAFTQGTDWIAVVTEDDRILIFDRLTGTLRQELQIAP
jgi:hypothetical protein